MPAPTPDTNCKRFELPIVVLVMLLELAAVVGLLWKNSGHSPRLAGDVDEGDSRRVMAGSAGIELDPAPGSDAGVVTESRRPGQRAHEEMLFLRFRYAGGAISLGRAERLGGVVKHQRSLMGKSGIYYRSLSDGGEVLADGVLPDPRRLHYTLPEGEGDPTAETTMHSGSLALAETEFVVRVPALAESSSLELFAVTPQDASLSRFASPENRLGSFPLAKSIATTTNEP